MNKEAGGVIGGFCACKSETFYKTYEKTEIRRRISLFIEKVMNSSIARECKIVDVRIISKDIIFFTKDLTVANIFLFDDLTLRLTKDLCIDDFCRPMLVSIKDREGC